MTSGLAFLRRLPRLAWRLEVGIWHSLARWVARRPDTPRGAEVFGYAEAVTPVLWLWIFVSACEIPLLHLLLPWPTAQLISLVLGLWGVLWMVGFLAGYRVFPHLMDGERLRVRAGPHVDVPVAWPAVTAVRTAEHDLPTTLRTVQLEETDSGTILNIAVSGRTNTVLELNGPTTLPTPDGPVEAIAVRFWSDDPRALAARVRQHLARV